MTDVFISSQGKSTHVSREELFMSLMSKDSGQPQNSIALPKDPKETYQRTAFGHKTQVPGNSPQDVHLPAFGSQKNDSLAGISSKDETVLPSMSFVNPDSKRNEGPSVKEQPLDGSAKNALTAASTETADVPSAASELGVRPPSFSIHATSSQSQRKLVKTSATSPFVTRFRRTSERKKSDERQDSNQGKQVTPMLKKEPGDFIANEVFKQPLAEGPEKAENGKDRHSKGSISTPHLAPSISKQTENTPPMMLKTKTENGEALARPNSLNHKDPSTFPGGSPADSLPGDHEEASTIRGEDAASAWHRLVSKEMTCLFWYRDGFCKRRDEDCMYAHHLCEYAASPYGPPIRLSESTPKSKTETNSSHSSEEKSLARSPPVTNTTSQTPIVDTLWHRERPVTFEDRRKVVRTIVANVGRRASPREFVAFVPDTSLAGLFGDQRVNNIYLRKALEDKLRPFVLANKEKFRDIPLERTSADSVEREGRHSTADYYRPGR
ncbi:hypothetical protein EV356DRAFT_512056 [Viridothelium virens]|uniref:C3H1-type domain-containing protein n=1 Tax=Viridothelium virens TaxID=1048519 RepID=A0A6A6GT38_VIRVR|nr:hypothetical protein EV356DRAFT_512056 [Viridothelium virens]